MRVIDYPLMPRPESREVTSIPVTFVANELTLASVAAAIRGADAVAVDTETHGGITRESDGLWMQARVISLTTRIGPPRTGSYQVFTIDLRDLDPKAVADTMAEIGVAYGWNADFDEEVLELYGAPVADWHDVKFDEALYWAGNPGRGWYLSLGEAARRYLNHHVTGKDGVRTSYDADSDLDADQINYAGYDSLITLYMAEHMADLLERDGLTTAATIEQGQRKFLRMMMTHGFPFDLDGWNEYLQSKELELVEARKRLAELTGAAGSDEPTFNPSSAPELKEAFNTFEPDIVRGRFGGRLFEPSDPVDSAMMKELKLAGSELADAVLRFRKVSKYLTTYGDSWTKYCQHGRTRPRYKQTLTSTGRLASDRPNGQNQPGDSKKFMRSAAGRLLFASDYSQAELRGLACMARDVAMLTAFRNGLDLHSATALDVFGVDIDELKKSDPDGAGAMRTKVKGVNFGIPYGMAAFALARRLTNEGVPTTPAEAKELIDKIMESRPEMAEWLLERDQFVKDFSRNPGPVDWEASFKLLDLFLTYDQERRNFRRNKGYWPTAEELVDHTTPAQLSLFEAPMTEEERQTKIADVDWAFRYDAPVVLRPAVEHNGVKIWDPVAFESRTVSGRRRVFAVVMDSGFQRADAENEGGGNLHGGKKNDKFAGLLTAAMLKVATTDKPAAAAIRDAWSAQHGIELPKGTDRVTKRAGESNQDFRARRREFEKEERSRCVKAFEGPLRPRKLEFVRYVCEQMGPAATEWLLSTSLTDCLSALGPAFRNHPIQGGVADVAGTAFHELYKLTVEYPDLIWVQTVHDSIIGEADEHHAREIAIRTNTIMEDAFTRWFPDVPAKVDTELCVNLGKDGVIEDISALKAELAAA